MAVVNLVDNFDVDKIDAEYIKSGFNHSFLLKNKQQIKNLVLQFKEEGYFLETITGYDKGDGIKLLYLFNRYTKVHRTVVYVYLDYFEEIDTISDIFPAAIWCESEVYDLLGNTFKGHPCLKRLLTPEGLQGYPLLKSWKEEE